MKKTLLTAHSGCDKTPDNSMEFVRHALTLDVDCLEVDVRWDKCGALILSHDESGAGTPLRQAFAALSAHPRMKINCDLKEAGLEVPVRALAEETGVSDRLVYSGTVKQCPAVAGIDWYLNVELIFPEAPSFADANPPAAADRIECAMRETGARCLNAHYAITDTPLYPLLAARGIPFSLWTPGEEHLIRRFLADGVFNITTRNARRACEIRCETRR